MTTIDDSVALARALAHIRQEKRNAPALSEEWVRLDEEERALSREYNDALEHYAQAFAAAHVAIFTPSG